MKPGEEKKGYSPVNSQQIGEPNNQKYILQEMRVELLKACPLLCIHCSANAAPGHSLLLPVERVLSLIDEFADGGGARVTFTGGEPLTYPDLERILQKCHHRNVSARLFSSGIVFDEKQHIAGLAQLKQLAPLLDTIMYSVYAAHADFHDCITRIPGSFHLTLEAVAYTVVLGIESELHFVPTRLNYRDLPALVRLAAELGVSKIGILRFVPQGRGKPKAVKLVLGKEEHLWLRHTILELRDLYPQVALHAGSAYNLLFLHTPIPCSAGLSQIVIQADGSILPCSAFSKCSVKDTFGNILEHPLQTVWEQSLYLQHVRQALDRARDCTGCLAQKIAVAGQIDTSTCDPLEELWH